MTDETTTGTASGTAEATGRALVPYDPARFERDTFRVNAGFWTKVRRVGARVPFLEDALAAYYCATDRKTPLRVKAILMGALAYFVVPTDMIPDFITGLGFTDDATVLLLALQTVSGHITDSHRDKAHEALDHLSGDIQPPAK